MDQRKNSDLKKSMSDPKLFYECNQSEISIIAPLLQEERNIQSKKLKELKELDDDYDDSDKEDNYCLLTKGTMQNNSNYKSKNSLNQRKLTRHFDEDEQEEKYSKNRISNQVSIVCQKSKRNSKTNIKEDQKSSRFLTKNKVKPKSDIESDYYQDYKQYMTGQPSIYDDQYSILQKYQKVKVNYLNILIIGKCNSGKFNFIEFLHKKCFQKNLSVDDGEVKLFREFVHRISNGRRGSRVISIIHSKGYENTHEMKEWYKNIKNLIQQKVESHEEMRDFLFQEKVLPQENLQDTRIHLCLFFVKSQSIPLSELLYIKKLSQIVNVVPVLIEETSQIKFDFEYLKIRARNQLLENNIEWFDLQDDDYTFKQFRQDLLAQTTPFLISVNKAKVCFKSTHSDVHVLAKMLLTPYMNTIYYKTEILSSKMLAKIRQKKKNKPDNREDQINNNLSLGLAIGLGFLGALVAVKNKIFQLNNLIVNNELYRRVQENRFQNFSRKICDCVYRF